MKLSVDRVVDIAVLLVLVLAHFTVYTAAPLEILWAASGAGGGVFAAHVLMHRLEVDGWRRMKGYNGLFKLTSRGHIVLRGLALLIQVLITVSGIAAMLTPSSVRADIQVTDMVISVCVLGVGVTSALACWYAEKNCEDQIQWAIDHDPEPEPMLDPDAPQIYKRALCEEPHDS